MVGIFAKTFPGTNPQEVLARTRQAGFSSVQYNFACSGIGSLPTTIDQEDIAAIKAASKFNNLDIVAISATYNMIDPDPARRTAGRLSFAAIAGAAEQLDCKIITVCSGSLNPTNQWQAHPDNGTDHAWTDMLSEFEYIIPIAQRHRLRIGVEPEHANIIADARKARKLLNICGTETLGIVFDAANLLNRSNHDNTIAEAAELLASNTILIHAKDQTPSGNAAAPGEGVINWPHYAKTLRNMGCNSPVVAHGFGLEKAAQVSHFLQRYF